MDKVMALINWVLANKEVLLQIVAYTIATATVIVKLTPTLADDNILLPFVKFVGKYIALNVSVKDEDRPTE